MRIHLAFLALVLATESTVRAEPAPVPKPVPAAEGKGKSMSVDRLTPRVGEWWFAMVGQGKTVGYARLAAATREGGGISYDWEMKMAFPGSEYEEERTLVLDAKWRLVSATFSMKGETLVEGKREGKRVKGTARQRPGGPAKAIDQELADDAISGMSFVLAACMPQEVGLALIRTSVNVPQGFRKLGTAVIRCREPEVIDVEGNKATARWFDSVGADGRIQKVWIGPKGRILQTDWGGGMMMYARSGSTRHLFKPIPSVLAQVPSGPETLVMRGEFAKVTPAAMFERWTKPDQLTRWWPPEAVVEPKVGGKYHLSWPARQYFLKGKITAYEPGEKLGFTWGFHHEKPDAPKREVTVTFAAREGGGTVLTITHGPYGEGEAEAKERSGHIDGWKFFCTKLAALE